MGELREVDKSNNGTDIDGETQGGGRNWRTRDRAAAESMEATPVLNPGGEEVSGGGRKNQ